MAILERIIPGLLKRNLRSAIHNLAELGRYDSHRQKLPARRAVLWETLSGAAAGIMQQLFIHNSDPWLDWGLKTQRRRVSQRALIAIYSWMVLYQLLLFRTHGLEGYKTEEEFLELKEVAQRFFQYVASAPEVRVEAPQPWNESWEAQSPEEAALGIYSGTMEALSLSDEVEEREPRAELFKTEAYHSVYELVVRDIVSKRNEATNH